MPTFIEFNCFKADMANGIHNLSSDEIKIALTTSAPSASTDTVFSDITEITAGNGYTAGGVVLPSVTSTQTSGTYTFGSANAVILATGGSITYRWVYMYNNTAVGKNVIGYFDEGSSIVIPDGSKRTITPSSGWIVGTSA